MLECARRGCDIEFEPAAHNQKYCGPECCRIATNERIMEKYYANRDRRNGKARYCNSCGVTKLSRYNTEYICNACKIKAQTGERQSLFNILSIVEA